MDLPRTASTYSVAVEHNYSTFQFKPLFHKKLEKSLSVSCIAKETENLLQHEESSDDDLTIEEKRFLSSYRPIGKNIDRSKSDRVKNGVCTNSSERRSIRSSVYCTSHLKYKRKWLRDVLLSDSSSSDEECDRFGDEKLREMLSEHVKLKTYKQCYQSVTDKAEYQDYSMGILGQGPIESVEINEKKQKGRPSGPNQPKKSSFMSSKKSGANSVKVSKKKFSSNAAKKSSNKNTIEKHSSDKDTHNDDDIEDGEIVLPYGYSDLESFYSQPSPSTSKTGPSTPSSKDREKDKEGASKDKKSKKDKKVGQEAVSAKRKRLWHNLVKKDIPKAAKMRQQCKKEKMSNAKKCAIAIMKQKRKEALSNQKTMTALQVRMRRVCKEVIIYWRRFERVEKQHLKKVQREAQEQRKADLNALENKRQTRKLNFLITQTELYAHFMAKKITGAGEEDKKKILERLHDDKIDQTNRAPHLKNTVHDDYDVNHVKSTIVNNVQDAYQVQKSRTAMFDSSVHMSADSNLGLSQPETASNEHPQPSILHGTLKSYQIKGMNWLANLYTQGINGILADEMGLGKTVQSIAFLAHLAEVHNIWGPFLVIAPASTLHNWEQECSRFVPKMKVVPYWGTTEMRKTLRKFWDQTHAHTEKASFHIVITSYQLVIQDAKFFQKINWIYMVLDEAQALKSSSSTRWRTLLGFNCRNRLLLTGTPIQNSMAELWALLHFIMPTLFDSHDEFKEWFSKDIESSVEKQTSVDQSHLSRLHMILKPFMLRRIKRDVENDLMNKIEILVYCPLTIRQRYLYDAIKRKIRIEDLLQSAAGLTANYSTSSSTSSLMNLVMQFRKVCNHPELFERRDIKLPAHTPLEPFTIPKLVWRDGLISTWLPSRQHILYNMFYIHNASNCHKLIRESPQRKGLGVTNVYSWLAFARLTSGDMYRSMFSGLLDLLKLAALLYKLRQIHNHVSTYNQRKQSKRRESLLFLNHQLSDDRENSAVLKDLLFTSYTSHAISHITHNHYYMRETQAHRKMRLRHMNGLVPSSPVKKRPSKALNVTTDVQVLVDEDSLDVPDVEMRELGKYHIETTRLVSSYELQLTDLPQFLLHNIHKAFSASLQWYVYDRSAEYQRLSSQYLSSRELYDTLRYGFTSRPVTTNAWRCEEPGGLEAVKPYYGFSQIYIPDKRSMIVDAGKMHVLDELLSKLKREGHRVLIYSTMTKLIDLLEEFMWFRKHMYMRLDGSSKISDRRDMVSEFQNRSDVFVFLLSTRAGGLGINLTAADTVIFYDSDWNPTVDAQAMDRAHRLGQTKQVTVYRLVCKGTIEERILERAREKSEIQRMVISGQNQFKPDVLKPKEVVSLLIDDDTIKHRLQQAQEEKMEKVEKRKMERTAKKEASSKKPRVTKKTVKENNVTTSAGPVDSPAASENTCEDQINIDVMGDDSIDADSLLEAPSSRASTPSVSSAPSTPSLIQSVKKQKSRPKTSKSSKARTPKQTSNLKKALNAAEIAGARAGMTAAYAQYGYNPTDSQSKSK